jgi:Ricin-type beta-trefoil lectin domain
MCSGAATTEVAAYYNTFPYKGTNDELYKQYMYTDGSGFGNNAEFKDNRLNQVACPDKSQGYTKNWYGVYGYTGLETGDNSISCRAGSYETIIQGLNALGLNYNTILSKDSFWSAPNQKNRLSIQTVKNSINAGKAIIMSTQNHIFVIKGYTNDNKVIVNDSWNDGNSNKTTYPSIYKFGAGFDSVYDLANLYPVATDSGYQTHFYAIEVWRNGFNPEPPTPFNNYTGQIWSNSDGYYVFDVSANNPADQTKVQIWQNNNGTAQKWGYNSSTKEIKGLNEKCLDAGDINNANNRWLRIHTCSGGNNQKWYIDNQNRIKSVASDSLCVDSYSGNSTGSTLYMGSCHSGGNQKWSNNIGITVVNPTTTYEKYMFKRTGTNQCMDVNNPVTGSALYTWDCDSTNQNQIWESIPNGGGGRNFRRLNTNKCIDAYQPYNGRGVYVWDCDYNVSNHAWYYDWNTKQLTQRNTSQCIAKNQPSNGSQINTWGCNNNDGNLKWDAVRVY